MSVILDALQKARGDRQKNQAEPNPNSVARVLEPVTPAQMEPAPARRSGRGLTVTLVFALVVLLGLAGGGFYLLYEQMRRLQPQPQVSTEAPIVPPVPMNPGTIATPSVENELAGSPGALPPPIPLSDLPIQPPAQAGNTANAPGNELPVYAPAPSTASAPNSPSAAAAQPQAAAPDAGPQFKLGSIVCENNICMALINGRTTREGDRIKGYVVSEITDKGVVLKSESGAGDIHLDLYN